MLKQFLLVTFFFVCVCVLQSFVKHEADKDIQISQRHEADQNIRTSRGHAHKTLVIEST